MKNTNPMEKAPMQRRKITVLITVALLAMAIMTVWPLSSSQHHRAREKVTAEDAPPAERKAGDPWEKKRAETSASPEKRSMSRIPLIESIELEKKQACPGETVQMVTKPRSDVGGPVEFTSPNGGDGNPAIVAFDQPGVHTIDVVARNGVGGVDYGTTELEILEPDSPECVDQPVISVRAAISTLEEDTADILVASNGVLEGQLHYTYEFGDGLSAESPTASVTHNYQLRAQNGPSSTFLVKVRARDEHGRTAMGRASVVFSNIAWLSRAVGSPMVPVAYTRFLEKRGDSIETELTFRNIEDSPVKFETAEVQVDSCTDRPPQVFQYPASQILQGLDTLPTGGVESTTLSLPVADVDGACRIVVVLAGDTVPPRAGHQLSQVMARTFDTTRAQISLDLAGPPLEGALAAAAPVAIDDEEFQTMLTKAQAILGNDRPITPEELQRLAREGRLQ